MKKNWNTAIGRLFDVGTIGVRTARRHPVVAAMTGGLLAALVLVLSFVDLSPALTSDQERQVHDFVIRTNSPAVARTYDQVRPGGLTANKVQRIIEVAKAQDPGYGLISDGLPPAVANP